MDYSFNEVTCEIDLLQLSDGGKLNVYSFSDLVA